jgi:hypothetical protein
MTWCAVDAVHLLRKFVIFSLFAPQRFRHGTMMLRGLADGLRGYGGRIDQARRGWQVPEAVRVTKPQSIKPAAPPP